MPPEADPQDAERDASPPAGRADDGSRWAGYGLALLFAAVFLVALARPYYPIATVFVIAPILLGFGVLVIGLAFRERRREG